MAFIVKILRIHCNKHSSGLGNDDLYLKIEVDGADGGKVPSSPSDQHSWNIGKGDDKVLQPESTLRDGHTVVPGTLLQRVFSNMVKVGLYDYDPGSGDDNLGWFQVDAKKGTDKKQNVSGGGSDYDIYYDVIEF